MKKKGVNQSNHLDWSSVDLFHVFFSTFLHNQEKIMYGLRTNTSGATVSASPIPRRTTTPSGNHTAGSYGSTPTATTTAASPVPGGGNTSSVNASSIAGLNQSRGTHNTTTTATTSSTNLQQFYQNSQAPVAAASVDRSYARHGANALTPTEQLVYSATDPRHTSSILAAVNPQTATREEELLMASMALSPKDLLARRDRHAIERRSKCIDLLSTSPLPDEVKRTLAGKLDENWVVELVEMKEEVPLAAWVEWCGSAMTDGANYVFAVRAKQKSLSLF